MMMRRVLWVCAVVACKQHDAAPPPAPPQPRDAAAAIDAAPSDEDEDMPEVSPPETTVPERPSDAGKPVNRKKEEAAAHAECVERAARKYPDPTDPIDTDVQPMSSPLITLVAAGAVSDRDGIGHPFEGPTDGRPFVERLTAQVDTLAPCYAKALERNPKAFGSIVIGAMLQEDGRLTKPRVIERTIRDNAFATCVRNGFGSFSVPGKSLGYNWEAYFELVVCPPDRTTCILGVSEPAKWRTQVRDRAVAQEARIASCFRKAVGDKHVHGLMEAAGVPSANGGLSGWSNEFHPFVGDDAQKTFEAAARNCLMRALKPVCLDPPPLEQGSFGDPSSPKIKIWFQH
ncbi:MAG TPA: hypothetical protein VL326_23080 [Kofleriaceae bacterium]|nr:hypothetical protein [Kofleriaceae bacterium]